MTESKVITAEEIQEWLIVKVSQTVEMPKEEIDIDQSIENFGMDSIMAVHITGEISTWIDHQLDPSLFFTHPTIKSSSEYIFNTLKGK